MTQFLINESTLRSWVGFSLLKRCKLFHRQFPNQHISPYFLHRFYKQHEIRFKLVKKVKNVPLGKIEENIEITDTVRRKIREALEKNIKIVFADETVFTKNTLPKRAFASKG